MKNRISKKLFFIICLIIIFTLLDILRNNQTSCKELNKGLPKSGDDTDSNSDDSDDDPQEGTSSGESGLRLSSLASSETFASSSFLVGGPSENSGSSDSSSEESSDENDSSDSGESSSDSDEESSGSSSSSSDEEPSTSSGIGIKRKIDTSKGHKQPPKKLKKEVMLTPNRRKFLRKFILDKHLCLLIAEQEVLVLGFGNLLLTNFWLEKNKLIKEKKFVYLLLKYLTNAESIRKSSYNQEVLNYYLEKTKLIKSGLVQGYESKRMSTLDQMNVFKASFKNIKCANVKLSFLIIFLIFGNNQHFTFYMYLLYSLLCSFVELKGIEFERSLVMLLKNENYLGSKISAIGGLEMTDFIQHIKYFFSEYSNYQILGMENFQNILYPLNFENINVEIFGFKYCIALFELHILSSINPTDKQVFLFFGSRFSSSSLVILANDIYMIAKPNNTSVTEVVATILFDNNIFEKIKKMILKLHNLDIRDFKSKFNYCLKLTKRFNELNGIRRNTDIQARSIAKSSSRRKAKLNLKYPFLN